MHILDTHTLLWYLSDSVNLSEKLKQFINECETVAVSIASLWEIAIKQSLGKLKIEASISEIEQLCYQKDILVLPINSSELDLLKSLPKLHGDPFDRLIICQTLRESAVLITKDSIIPEYPVKTLWC